MPLAYYSAFQALPLPIGPLQGGLGTQSVLPTLALAGLRPAALLQSEAKLLSVHFAELGDYKRACPLGRKAGILDRM